MFDCFDLDCCEEADVEVNERFLLTCNRKGKSEMKREIYTKMTQAFKEVYQQTHAPKVGQTTSRVIITACNIDLWH